MSRSLRAQISLIFSDEDLFDNFVTPLKENKELSGTIVKLLSAYYYNEDVRDLVEGTSVNDIEGVDQVIDSTEAINQMRQTLAMQDYLFEQARQTLDDGASEMDALIKANDIARQSGVVRTESTDVGEALIGISLGNMTSNKNTEDNTVPNNGSDLESRVTYIENSLSEIMTLLKSGLASQTSQSSESIVNYPTTSELSETTRLNDVSQVLNNKNNVEPELHDSSSDILSSSLEKENSIKDENNIESLEDATSELNDMLLDLLG